MGNVLVIYLRLLWVVKKSSGIETLFLPCGKFREVDFVGTEEEKDF